MMNTGNICIFEGRMVADPQVGTINYNSKNGPQQTTKVEFTLAVDKNLSTAQKQQAQTAGKAVSDFPKFEAIGATAEFIAKWAKKGKPLRVVAEFETFKYKDKQGNMQYGYKFNVQNAGFTIGDAGIGKGTQNNAQAPQQNNSVNNTQQQGGFNAPAGNELPW